jgi:hypothetical protein
LQSRDRPLTGSGLPGNDEFVRGINLSQVEPSFVLEVFSDSIDRGEEDIGLPEGITL